VSVKIRLQRVGTKKKPFYRIVAADGRNKRDGAVLEQLGKYQPITNGVQVSIDEEKVLVWIKKGAQPTETVKEILKRKGIWQKALAK
jgi:small subunit ribosomal protein S16